ncbi:MAG: tetratricopeptide repeat protein, partial [Candidatus Aminicenantes bacterium]
MLKLKKAAIYKAIAVVLCIFIAFEAHYLLAFQTTNTMREQFEQAKKAYFEEDYELARTILEEYVAQLDALEGFDNLKGETYLLLGAAYEALKDKEPAIKYYCLAKDILGQGATIEGIKLVKLRWYWAKCPIKVAGVVGKRKRKSTGAFIGVLVGLGIITGFFWYFFFSKNSPLKFETKDNESDGDSDEDYVFSSQCFSTEWTVTLNSKFEGGSGQVIVDPWPIVGPIPNENNEWYEVFTVQITIEGIQYFKSFELL